MPMAFFKLRWNLVDPIFQIFHLRFPRLSPDDENSVLYFGRPDLVFFLWKVRT